LVVVVLVAGRVGDCVVVVVARVVVQVGMAGVCHTVAVVPVLFRVRVGELMVGVTDAIVSIVLVGVGEAPLRLAVGKGCVTAFGADVDVVPVKMANAVDATAATVRRPTAPRTIRGPVRMVRARWTLSGSPMSGRPSEAAARRGRPVGSVAPWLGSSTRLTSRFRCSEGERCVRNWRVRAVPLS